LFRLHIMPVMNAALYRTAAIVLSPITTITISSIFPP
jgi:hypothetical protein